MQFSLLALIVVLFVAPPAIAFLWWFPGLTGVLWALLWSGTNLLAVVELIRTWRRFLPADCAAPADSVSTDE